MLSIFAIPSALTYYLGRMAKNQGHGWAVWGAMFALFLAGVLVCWMAEAHGNPIHQKLGVAVADGNMEGKEVRFGAGESVLTTIVTSNTSTGSYNSMQDSFQPMGVLPPLVFMLLGEVVFGGLGAGVYSIVMTALVAVFLGGLMVGRTPEYLGKRIGVAEARWIAMYALLTPTVVLSLTGLAIATQAGLAGLIADRHVQRARQLRWQLGVGG